MELVPCLVSCAGEAETLYLHQTEFNAKTLRRKEERSLEWVTRSRRDGGGDKQAEENAEAQRSRDAEGNKVEGRGRE